MTASQPFTATPADILAFWRDAGPERWFRKDDAFDAQFRSRFLAMHEAAARGAHDSWAQRWEGALALLLLTDQFPRNSFRGTPRMFATDGKALAVAKAAADSGLDAQADLQLRQFFYLPFMHSEVLAEQDRSVELNRKLGGEPLRYAIHHRGIVEKFGRFPHRNQVLGRTTTPEEQSFLDSDGFKG